MAFAALPAVFKAFRATDDTFVIASMKRAQAELLFYEQKRGSFQYVCLDGGVGMPMQDILLDSGKGVSCMVNREASAVMLFTRLNTGEYYCVDSTIFAGALQEQPNPFVCTP